MKRSTQEELVQLCLGFVEDLKQGPKTFRWFRDHYKMSRERLRPIFVSLKEANIIAIERREHNHIILVPGEYAVNDIRAALGYPLFNTPNEVDCTECGDPYTRILLPNGNLVDEQGRRWDSRRCPDCVVESRTAPNSAIEMTSRRCRHCRSFLPSTRYFDCYVCRPRDLSVRDDNAIYNLHPDDGA